MPRHSKEPRTESAISGINPHSGSQRFHEAAARPLGITPKKTHDPSTPSNATATSPAATRTLPPSIPLLEAASLATLYLKSTVDPTSSVHNPEILGNAFARRQAARTAYTLFSCGRSLFVPYGGMALLNRGIINVPPGHPEFEQAADRVWIRVIMYEPQQRQLWDDAAKEIKVALDTGKITNENLVKARGLPKRKAEYEAWAAGAVEELLQQVLEKWARERGRQQGDRVSEAEETESSLANTETTTTETETEPSSEGATTVTSSPEVVVTPPMTPLAHRIRPSTPAMYPPSVQTPQSMPPRNRDSMHTIAESLDINDSEGEEPITSVVTERLTVTPMKARIVDVKVSSPES